MVRPKAQRAVSPPFALPASCIGFMVALLQWSGRVEQVALRTSSIPPGRSRVGAALPPGPGRGRPPLPQPPHAVPRVRADPRLGVPEGAMTLGLAWPGLTALGTCCTAPPGTPVNPCPLPAPRPSCAGFLKSP
jgi:hypothetical protein